MVCELMNGLYQLTNAVFELMAVNYVHL